MLTKNAKDLINAFGYLHEVEGILLQKYAKEIPQNGICINIGAGAGTSAICILEKRPDLTNTFYTIDIRNWNNPFGGLLNEKNAFKKYDMPLPKQIYGDSKTIGREWKKEKVDFLIIDGDHSRAGARGDILAWEENLKPGAIIFVHDYENSKWIEVRRAVNELMYDNDDYDCIDKADRYIVFRFTGEESN